MGWLSDAWSSVKRGYRKAKRSVRRVGRKAWQGVKRVGRKAYNYGRKAWSWTKKIAKQVYKRLKDYVQTNCSRLGLKEQSF